MEKKYHVYALGNALVDTEVEVTDEFLTRLDLSKGLMTLVDEARQQELVAALAGEAEPHKHTCGGSATSAAAATTPARWPTTTPVTFSCATCRPPASTPT